MRRAWKLIKGFFERHALTLIILAILIFWAWLWFPKSAWPYDSMTVNGDGSRTYTVTASTTDGYVHGASATWSTSRTTGTSSNASDTALTTALKSTHHSGEYLNTRDWFPFDLTGIASGTVLTATFSVVSYGYSDAGALGSTVFVQGTATLPLDTSDFTAYGSTEIASRSTWNPAWASNTRIEAPLNTAGKAAVQTNLGGAFQVAMIEHYDFDDSAPPNETFFYANLYYADHATASYHPRLVLTVMPQDFSDFFDDASIDAKWTTGDFVGGSGTITEAGGYLTMAVGAGPAVPYAYQAGGILSSTFDVRLKVHLDSSTAPDSFLFFVAPAAASAATDSVNIAYDMASHSLYRQDSVGGSATSGPSISIGTGKDFVFRIVGNGDGTFACYCKPSLCSIGWTALSADTPYTSGAFPLDCGMYEVSGGNAGTVDFDWIVLDSENPGLPAECPALAGPIWMD